MNYKKSDKSMWMFGLQFTSMMITPVLVCILGGLYIQKKYNLGEWFIIACVCLAIILIFSNLYAFAKTAVKISENSQKAKGDIGDKKSKP